MSVHSIHPPIADEGLADDCERCREISQEPFLHMDDANLCSLMHRVTAWRRDRAFPRSTNEHHAMTMMEQAIVRYDRMERLWAEADGPTDDQIYNRVGVEGGIAYDTTADEPGSMGEDDWRL